MFEQRQPALVVLYEHYLADQDGPAYAEQVAHYYLPGTLARLLERGPRLARRGAALALGLLADFEQGNSPLGRALRDADRGVRSLAESAIRNVWRRFDTAEVQRELSLIVRQNRTQQFAEAEAAATSLILRSPAYAEAWNQRAISRYALGRYAECVADCHMALELNPYHFGAASGQGQCHLRLADSAAALECFRRALKLNPEMENIRALVLSLERDLKRPRK